jgi:hypothetical protein
MTEAEYAQWQQDQSDFAAAQEAAAQQAAEALEARKTPLRRLGLTEEEINTVLGL